MNDKEATARLIIGFLLLGETFTTHEANVLIVLEVHSMPGEEAGMGGTNYSVNAFVRAGLIAEYEKGDETRYRVTNKGKELLK